MTVFEDAAMKRQIRMDTPADKPFERRSGEAAQDHRMAARTRFEVREVADTEPYSFEGIASVTERGYEMWDWAGPYTEVVSRGAFGQTLARDGLYVPLVLWHDQGKRIASTTNHTLSLAETDEGLSVDASLNRAYSDVQDIVQKLRDGLYDEMSFAFRITDGMWSPDYTEYRINAVDIHRGDVSIVGYGANPFTSAGVRSAAPAVTRSVHSSQTLFDVRYGAR